MQIIQKQIILGCTYQLFGISEQLRRRGIKRDKVMNEPHIDKTGRKKYGFDEVCLQVNESIKDPATEGR